MNICASLRSNHKELAMTSFDDISTQDLHRVEDCEGFEFSANPKLTLYGYSKGGIRTCFLIKVIITSIL